MDTKDIAWLAGLFEGEACFDYAQHSYSPKKYPRIRIEMTDKDIIYRVNKLVGGKLEEKKGKQANHSTTYLAKLYSRADVEPLLKMILPYMGKRRSAKIQELLDIYKFNDSLPKKIVNKK